MTEYNTQNTIFNHDSNLALCVNEGAAEAITAYDDHLQEIKNLNQNSHTEENINWKKVAYHVLSSRYMDKLEEEELAPKRKIFNQFSARGHELTQVILGTYLNHKHDAVLGYYRSRPLLLSLGLTLEDALAGPLAKEGGLSSGRDIGVVYNLRKKNSPTVLPMHGGVGGQYTPVTGWAQALVYQRETLGNSEYQHAIAVSHGGEASVSTNGFWAALTNATTLNLPQLFFIEDNGYGISVSSDKQVPGGDITENLKSFGNLTIYKGDGTDPEVVNSVISKAVRQLRSQASGPVLIRFKVPRLCGHTFQDDQSYKSEQQKNKELENDPLSKLKDFFTQSKYSESEWDDIELKAKTDVQGAFNAAMQRNSPDKNTVTQHVFSEKDQIYKNIEVDDDSSVADGPRINMITSIRKTLDSELSVNEKMVVFGEDVGAKGGVHTATLGLQDKYGESRVFDTNLSEEGIIGRAVGMAYANLRAVPEIQFRKYADSAAEQLHDCGTVRWRTNNKFSAPIVVRMPVGFSKRGDPWHAECKEAAWAHSIGWQVVFASNAADAAGLLRTALRSENPTIFLEHRAQLDSMWAKRAWPGDEYTIAFGKARVLIPGDKLTLVTWGAMVEVCDSIARQFENEIELIDLRTIVPWDKDCVFSSVMKTGKALIVHEDTLTAGFGSEISAQLVEHCFDYLDAPVKRIAMPDIPCPHNVDLMHHVLPNSTSITDAINSLLEY